jgi:hypothetical protein
MFDKFDYYRRERIDLALETRSLSCLLGLLCSCQSLRPSPPSLDPPPQVLRAESKIDRIVFPIIVQPRWMDYEAYFTLTCLLAMRMRLCTAHHLGP